jgi:hypothetical protein
MEEKPPLIALIKKRVLAASVHEITRQKPASQLCKALIEPIFLFPIPITTAYGPCGPVN